MPEHRLMRLLQVGGGCRLPDRYLPRRSQSVCRAHRPEHSPFHERARQLPGRRCFKALRAVYAAERPGEDDEMIDKAIMGDAWFRVPSLRIADAHARHAARGPSCIASIGRHSCWVRPCNCLIVFGNGVPLGIALGFANWMKPRAGCAGRGFALRNRAIRARSLRMALRRADPQDSRTKIKWPCCRTPSQAASAPAAALVAGWGAAGL